MERRGKSLTLAEMLRENGISLRARHFVPELSPFPVPRVPEHLMEGANAEEARSALNECINTIGPFGERKSLVDSPEFQETAERFEEITGIKAIDVFEYAEACFSANFV